MSLRSIARNYARALSDTLADDATVRRVESDLCSLARAMDEMPDLAQFLAGPIVPTSRKREAADQILSSSGASDGCIGLVRLLIDRHRIALMGEIAEEFSAITRERLGLVDAEVISASPLTDEMKSKALASLGRLTGLEVRARFRVDPDVIGGMRAQVGHTIYDGSVRSRIDRLRERFARN